MGEERASKGATVTHRGSCHCGRVRIEVDGPPAIRVLECSCSICRRSGYLHWIVPRSAFRLLSGEDALTSYRFGTRTAQHRFCGVCGIKAFYIPRSHPEGYSVNARCLEPGTVSSCTVQEFDGARWEESAADLDSLERAGPPPSC